MRIGIIGVGRMGRRIIQAIIMLRYENLLAYDKSEPSINQAKEEFGDKLKFVKDINSFFDSKIDLLIIATTADSHFEYMKMAVEENIPYILCEKPIVRSFKEYKLIKQYLQNSDSKIAVNHQMRFLTQYTQILELQTQYKLGEVSSIIFNSGNFGLSNNGSHKMEAARFICKSNPKSVYGFIDSENLPNPRGADFHDKSGIIKVKMESGVDVIINAKARSGHGSTANYFFRNGFIFVDELQGMLYLNCRKEEFLAESTTRYGMPNIVKSMQIAPIDIITSTSCVIQNLLTGKDYPTLEDGFNAIKVIMASFLSQGKEINLETFTCEDEFKWS